ncbi:hypothetical protein D3C73_1187720 [compost metagenome]
MSHLVSGQDVRPPAQHHGRNITDGVQQLPEPGPHFLRGAGITRGTGAVLQQVHHVRMLPRVQAKRPGHRVEDRFGRVDVAALFKARVVVGTHSGEPGNFLAAESGHPAGTAGFLRPGVLG